MKKGESTKKGRQAKAPHRFKPGNKLGRLFTTVNQPRSRGRKPSRINQFIKAFSLDDPDRRISKEDAYKLMAHILSCSKAELETMARNPDLPISIVSQIKAIITELSLGKTDTVDKIFDRLYGKSTQPMELTGSQGTTLIPGEPMTRKEYETLLASMKGGANNKRH